MPIETAHISQARHNRQFLADLKGQPTPYRDWIVTVAFYVAVHRIEAYFSRKMNFHSKEHQVRNGALAKLVELKPVFLDYQELYNKSMESRYDSLLGRWTNTEVERILGKLDAIEAHLDKLGQGNLTNKPSQ